MVKAGIRKARRADAYRPRFHHRGEMSHDIVILNP
jgi:hypothetical protein